MERELPTPVVMSMDEMIHRARSMVTTGVRRMLGITGAPGAGKSTVCAALSAALGSSAAIVGMDGFHVANAELDRLGRRDRKGAPDTFDVPGYVALLGRLREQRAEVVYGPIFDRGLDASIGSAVAVSPETPLVITEGNYLLHDQGGWSAVRPQLDAVWYLDVPPELLIRRLIARRQSFGQPLESARAWVQTVDTANSVLVQAARRRADLVIAVAASVPKE